jgi:transcriptional regulator with XRE-family HTH domain
MNGDQLRMARALLRLTVRELAQASGVDKMAIVRFEVGRNPHAATLSKLQAALEERGIVFIGAVTTFHEPTVAMRFGMQPPAAHDGDDDT